MARGWAWVGVSSVALIRSLAVGSVGHICLWWLWWCGGCLSAFLALRHVIKIILGIALGLSLMAG